MNTVTLDREDAPRAARRLVAADCASAAAGPACAEAAAVLTSEVVTNAVLHGNGRITLGIQVDSHCCRVEVGDDALSAPRIRGVDESAEGGRGMLIVDALASDWGVSDRPVGKTVWFEVPAQP
jgi:anti-sigma regulatory factor (Ser/Thr protein kinase)